MTTPCYWFGLASLALSCISVLAADKAPSPPGKEGNPADQLPPHIRRLTWFGERADWSHDGQKILFIEKTYGDAYEVNLDGSVLRPVTHHFHHGGFTRALYLANGDILLSGAMRFDAAKPHVNRTEQAELWVLDRSLRKPPVRLGEKCSEGPAVSRRHMRIAWTVVHSQYPDQLQPGQSQIWLADLETGPATVRLVNKRLVLDSKTLPFKCTLESQNFRPPEEKELTFSSYGYQGTEVMGVHLETGQVTNYSDAPGQYDEPEGIFPDGRFTLVECDKPTGRGWQFIDIWKLALDGSGKLERLTHFSDYAGFKASNPVVRDNGRWMAFQLAKTTEAAGVGHGIFIYDLEARNGELSK